MTPTFKPHCPNHGCPLDGIGFPMPQVGVGMCPVSGASFEFACETDETKVVQDKFGGTTKEVKWSVTGND